MPDVMEDKMAYRGKLISEMTIVGLTKALNETRGRLENNQIITSTGFENYTNDIQCLWQIEHYLVERDI